MPGRSCGVRSTASPAVAGSSPKTRLPRRSPVRSSTRADPGSAGVDLSNGVPLGDTRAPARETSPAAAARSEPGDRSVRHPGDPHSAARLSPNQRAAVLLHDEEVRISTVSRRSVTATHAVAAAGAPAARRCRAAEAAARRGGREHRDPPHHVLGLAARAAGGVVTHREEPLEEVSAGRAFVFVERHGRSVTGAYAVVLPPAFGAKREYSQSMMTATTVPPIHAIPR